MHCMPRGSYCLTILVIYLFISHFYAFLCTFTPSFPFYHFYIHFFEFFGFCCVGADSRLSNDLPNLDSRDHPSLNYKTSFACPSLRDGGGYSPWKVQSLEDAFELI